MYDGAPIDEAIERTHARDVLRGPPTASEGCLRGCHSIPDLPRVDSEVALAIGVDRFPHEGGVAGTIADVVDLNVEGRVLGWRVRRGAVAVGRVADGLDVGQRRVDVVVVEQLSLICAGSGAHLQTADAERRSPRTLNESDVPIVAGVVCGPVDADVLLGDDDNAARTWHISTWWRVDPAAAGHEAALGVVNDQHQLNAIIRAGIACRVRAPCA